MSSSPLSSPSPGETTSGLGGIMIRFKQGRTIYSGREMQRVCDHYISTARHEAQASLFVFQFIRSACLAFASTHAIAQLKNLPEPTTQTTLDQHLSILLGDKAPLRMQTEVEAHPGSLFFVGEVVPSEGIRSLAPGNAAKPASRIPRELSQSCLAILRRYEDGIDCFPREDVQTMCSYMKELCIRGGDVWIVLVSFLRDAARPFASTGIRRKLGKPSTLMDQNLVVSQYNTLIDDGAMDRLLEAARTRRNPSFSVKPDDSPSLVETDLDDDSTCGEDREAVSGRKVHELLKQAHSRMSHVEVDGADDWAEDNGDGEDPEFKERLRYATKLSSPVKQNDNREHFRVELTGQTGPAGNALPSFAKGQKRRHEDTMLTPREIRDLVRQVEKHDAHSRQVLLAQKEVFYIGGSKKYQMRPEYFWVLMQDLEEDEPTIPEDKMTTIFPEWKQLESLRNEQGVASGKPVSPKKVTLQALADKVDALAKEVTAMARTNEDLRREIREMPASPCSCQKNGLSSNSASSSKRRFKPEIPTCCPRTLMYHWQRRNPAPESSKNDK